jgi:hypothetical protein
MKNTFAKITVLSCMVLGSISGGSSPALADARTACDAAEEAYFKFFYNAETYKLLQSLGPSNPPKNVKGRDKETLEKLEKLKAAYFAVCE